MSELFAGPVTGNCMMRQVLREQTRRMLKDPKVNRFALEFFGQWFGYREFLKNEAVNRQVFPTFDDSLRQAMFEEPTRLATYLIQKDLPITDLLHSDKTFVTRKLAEHYGVPFAGKDGDWEMADGPAQAGARRHPGDGRVPHEELATAADQPREARLLGDPQVARRTYPAAAAGRRRPARQGNRHQRQDDSSTHGPAHRKTTLCACRHVRFDFVGLSMEGFDPIGQDADKGPGRP